MVSPHLIEPVSGVISPDKMDKRVVLETEFEPVIATLLPFSILKEILFRTLIPSIEWETAKFGINRNKTTIRIFNKWSINLTIKCVTQNRNLAK